MSSFLATDRSYVHVFGVVEKAGMCTQDERKVKWDLRPCLINLNQSIPLASGGAVNDQSYQCDQHTDMESEAQAFWTVEMETFCHRKWTADKMKSP